MGEYPIIDELGPGPVQWRNSYAQSGWALLQKNVQEKFLTKLKIYKKDYMYLYFFEENQKQNFVKTNS